MKATVAGLAVFIGLACLYQTAHACPLCPGPPPFGPAGCAPSPSNMPGFYTWSPGPTYYGTVMGPHYYLHPPFAPFNGMLPGDMGRAIGAGRGIVPAMYGQPGTFPPGMAPYPGMAPMAGPPAGGGLPPHVATPYGGPPNPRAMTPVFPTHPYVRGPRDFFMWRENMEERAAREARPLLVP